MMKPIIISFFIIVGLGLAASFAWSILGSDAEHAKYDVIESQGDIEIRSYPPMIVAEVRATGSREVSIKEGFRGLASYIFGDNKASGKIAMTAPVMQQQAQSNSSQKIPMTAPVMQQSNGTEWTVTFMMPSRFKLGDLPVPNNAKIKMREQGEKRYAVIRFSGIATSETIAEKETKLKDYLKLRSSQPLAAPIYAFFNPPYTLPFLRRNEIMIEIKS